MRFFVKKEKVEDIGIAPFIKRRSNEKRLRLDFGEVEQKCPELANTAMLVRDRASDLWGNLERDATWTHRWFSAVTMVAIGIALLAAVAGTSFIPDHSVKLPGAITVSVGSISALLAAGIQAFGLHKRFSAMISAQWAMMALRTRIDQTILRFALSIDESGELDAKMREDLHKALAEWTDEMSRVMSTFGKAYGAVLEPVKLSKQKDE